MTGAIGKHQLERSMGQHVRNDLGYAGKQTANVQHFRDRAKECAEVWTGTDWSGAEAAAV